MKKVIYLIGMLFCAVSLNAMQEDDLLRLAIAESLQTFEREQNSASQNMISNSMEMSSNSMEMSEEEILRQLEEESIQDAIEKSLLDQGNQSFSPTIGQPIFELPQSSTPTFLSEPFIFTPDNFVSTTNSFQTTYKTKRKKRFCSTIEESKGEDESSEDESSEEESEDEEGELEEKTLAEQYLKNNEHYRPIQTKKLTGKTAIFILPVPKQRQGIDNSPWINPGDS